jgi:DnaJ-domain-containing protein 1
MTDFFALLEEPRRPWLDAEALKEKYHGITARQHPDVGGGSEEFAEINRAYQTLSDPVARLRHLLELEVPDLATRAQPVPGEVAEYFEPVGKARQAAEGFLKKRAAAASPLAKALLSTEQFEVQEGLENVIGGLQEKQEELLSKVREADAVWENDRASVVQNLPVLWQSLGYVSKWLATLRESLFRVGSI